MTIDPVDQPPFRVERSSDGGVPGLVVTGEVDVATSPQLRHARQAVSEAGHAPIVVDLSGLTFIDSSGLGVLVSARNALRERGSERGIVLRGLPDSIRKVFEVTGLTGLFTPDDG